VPVRIALDPAELVRHPLRLGLSTRVEIDTRERGGAVMLQAGAQRIQYATAAFRDEGADADRIVARVLAGVP
jgi:membrane fusion protein (multidrug efflux system)